MRHAHLDDGDLMLRLEFQQHQRQAEMIVEVAFRLQTRKRAESTWAIASLVVVLPADPVTPISGLPHRRRTAARQRLQSDQRVVDRQQPGLYRIARQFVLADDRGHGALLQRLLDKIVAIHAFAFDREEKFAGLDGARVDRVSLGDRLVVEFAAGRNEFGDSRKRQLHATFSGGGVRRLAVVSGIAQDFLRDFHIVKRDSTRRG